jgi:6-phosphogluconolactonase (cycloisomerase 2 family)
MHALKPSAAARICPLRVARSAIRPMIKALLTIDLNRHWVLCMECVMTVFPDRAAQARTTLVAAPVLMLVACGGGGIGGAGSVSMSTSTPDTTVTNLEFSAVTAAVPGQTQTSNPVTIEGLGAGVVVPVVASAGMTIIKNGVAVAGQSTTAKNGDSIAVQIAPLGYGQTSDLTLSVGSSSAQWDVTSMPLGGSISGLTGTGLKLQVNLGANLAVSPGATSFSFAAPIALGKTYSVTVNTQPGSPPQFCNLSGGSGTVGSGTANISLLCIAPAGVAYIANSGSSSNSTPTNSISEYLIDPTTGALINIGTIAAGASPSFVAANPKGDFVYVTSTSSATVSAYSVAASGVLSPIGAFTAGAEPISNAINPAGSFEYVANYGSSSVSEFAVNATTGALTSIGSVGVSGVPSFITIDPTGRFAYTTNNNSSSITAYTIDSSSGALANQGTVACAIPLGMAIAPNAHFAYVTCGNGVGIRSYGIDQTTGVLTNIGTYAAGNTIYSSAVNPAGTFAYFSNWGGEFSFGPYSIDTYSVDSSSGALALTGSVATSEATQFTVDPSGKWLLSRDSTANIGVYSIDAATGALTLLASTAIAIPGPSAMGIINIQ